MSEIQTKLKNLKASAKTSLLNNAREMSKTGGGSASLVPNNEFNFSQKQISGLSNPFDSDTVNIGDIPLIESGGDAKLGEVDSEDEKDKKEVLSTPTVKVPEFSLFKLCFEFFFSGQSQLPRYNNSKMKLSAAKNNLIELKEQQLRLDNKYKKLKIRKIMLEIATMKQGGCVEESKMNSSDDSDF